MFPIRCSLFPQETPQSAALRRATSPLGRETASDSFRLAGRRKTLRAYACPPCRNCHSRACFATARQWRGCGNCGPPASATGSGRPQFLAFFDRCGNSGFPSSATGGGNPQFPLAGEPTRRKTPQSASRTAPLSRGAYKEKDPSVCRLA